MTAYQWSFRVATSSAGLQDGGALKARGITVPDLALYDDHSQRLARQDGGQALRGFAWLEWFWTEIDDMSLWRLNQLIDAAWTAGTPLYLTTDISGNGLLPAAYFVDLQGVPLRPEARPIAQAQGRTFNGVTFRVNNITIINNPAVGL